MHKSCALVALLSISVAFGCGGGQKPPAEPKKSSDSLSGTEVKPDLTALEAPKDVIAVARVERLENASATIARWMNVPFDLRMLDALGPGLSRTLNVNAPVEAVVALAEGTDTELLQPYAVFSAGLVSVDAGRTMFETFGRKLDVLSPGIWITVDESPVACAIAPALGRANVRLVCGSRRVDIENLLPYATRGLPLLAMGSADAHLELRLAPLRERYGQRLKQGKAIAVPMALAWMGISDTRVSRPITDILYALGDEILDVVDDLDRISLDARFATGPERIDVSTSLSFARARSWAAQATVDSGKRAAPAPEVFFALPQDSGAATYVIPSNPRMFETIAHRLETLFDGVLLHFEVNPKVREDFVRSIDRYASQPWGGVCGEGEPSQAAEGKTGEEPGMLNTLNAWQVCAYDSLPAAVLTNLLDAGGKLVADKKVQRLLGEGSFSVRRRAAGRGLPAGSSVYDVKINTEAFEAAVAKWGKKSADAEKAGKKPKLDPSKTGTLHIYVVPDTNRTWIGSGTDPKAIEAHLVTARTAGGAGHLSAQDLGWLRETPAVAGGFVSLAHLGAIIAARGSKHLKKRRLDEAFAVAPHHGQTRIPFTVEVRGSSSAPELLLNARLDKALFEDLVAMTGQTMLKTAK